MVAGPSEAAAAGVAILELGGTAIDAAVSAAVVACVAQPADATIAGSGFMIVQDERGKTWSVEFPARAPRHATPPLFVLDHEAPKGLLALASVENEANAVGCLAPGIPGAVAGLCLAHQRFGALPLSRVLEPAIELATSGIEVDAYCSLQLTLNAKHIARFPATAQIFTPDQEIPVGPFATPESAPSIRLPQHDLARTLAMIGERGPGVFYTGEIAHAIVDHFAAQGGLLDSEDLAHYRASCRSPISYELDGGELFAPNSPSGSWTVLQALAVLRRVRAEGASHNSKQYLHAVIESLHRSFADRYAYMADPEDGGKEPSWFLAPERISLHASEFMENQAWEGFGAESDPWAQFSANHSGHSGGGHGTTHVSAIDRTGRAASCTLTAADSFGSKVVVPGTGILFDNAMLWFDPVPGSANSIAGGKRPLVNMSPVIARTTSGRVIAVGAPGGRRIISAVAQLILNLVDFGMPAEEAINAPRIDASGSTVLASERIDSVTLDDLRGLGHRIQKISQQHHPFSYEFARPSAAVRDREGRCEASIEPFSTGTALASRPSRAIA